ncbi:Nuclear envelope pore membrane protein POM 121 [Manis javanica]|nr:Nuclear envelope pore membrane protein POM 121 [Manis javanica]
MEEEEDQTSAAGQEEKRRCQDSSVRSAFTPVLTKGVRTPFVPKPGPLKRGLSSQSSDGELCKRPCTSAVSCSKGTCACGIRMSSRNAITSSYTSTGGISQLWKRRPSASPFSSPASSRSQTPERPEKKIRDEDGHQGSGSSAPPVDKETQGEQDTTTCREQNSWDSPATPSSSQPRRRKFPLVPSRREIPLILPPAPWIGHSITVEEHYQEKQAQSQWLKRIFEDKTATTSDFEATTQTTSSGGSRTSSYFTSGVSAGPAGSGDFGMSVSAPHSSSTTGAFDFVAGRSGRTGGMAPFWGCLSQNSLGTAGQSTLFAIYVASTPQNMSVLAAITSGIGAVSQSNSCGTSTSGFGSTISVPCRSRVSAGPTGSGGCGTSVTAHHSSSTTGTFSVGSGWSGKTGIKNHFGGALNPNSLGAAGQSTPSAFHVASTQQNMPGFPAITSAFEAMTLTTSSGPRSVAFGGTTSSPFTS